MSERRYDLEQNAIDNMGSVSNTETRKPDAEDFQVSEEAVETLHETVIALARHRHPLLSQYSPEATEAILRATREDVLVVASLIAKEVEERFKEKMLGELEAIRSREKRFHAEVPTEALASPGVASYLAAIEALDELEDALSDGEGQ